MTACIGEPISWPRLESFALGAPGAPDPVIASHLAACPACRQCLAQIQGDVIALPPLVVPAKPLRAAGRRRWLAPAFAFAFAAVVLLVVLRRPASRDDEVAGAVIAMTQVKGVGEVTLELVRERGGEVSFEARRFAPGDRWKVVVSCPPDGAAPATVPMGSAMRSMMWIDVSVADGVTTDHPLAPARLPCGNRVVVPGAFTVTGTSANRVCVRIAAGPGVDAGTACLTLRPE